MLNGLVLDRHGENRLENDKSIFKKSHHLFPDFSDKIHA